MKFQISCLLFIRDLSNRLLLIRRRKPPNLGTWSPPGGKLEMHLGESPYECAKREALEEVGLKLKDKDLSLFGYISEKAYEGNSHWLMFMFDCLIPLEQKPAEIDEGNFQFYDRNEINDLQIPPTDHKLVWPFYDRRTEGFWCVRTDCSHGVPHLEIEGNTGCNL
jgi:8-oxo-dGTP diphosphatase